MTRQEALKIIKNEDLDGTNLFDITKLHFESTVIIKTNNSWEVYVYGERGEKDGLAIYNNESDALLDYLDRLRAWKRIESYRRNREAR